MKKLRTILILAACLFPLALAAAPLDETLAGWRQPHNLSGPIMEVGPGYLIVSESRVTLVDYHVGGRHLKTRIRSLDGQPLSLASLRSGRQVVVKGGVVLDGRREVFFARDIWLVPDSAAAGLQRLKRARPEAW